MLNSGDKVKFVTLSASQYDGLSTKDDATVYFITSEFEQRIALGDSLFANYVPAHCTSVSLDKATSRVEMGSSFILSAVTEPANPSDTIVWQASNENVTLIALSSSNKVEVRGVSAGDCVVTCTCGDIFATCAVTVHEPYVYTEHILVQNYQCDGSTFKYTAPISLSGGNYIEVSMDISNANAALENILSIGQNIDLWETQNTGPRVMFYYPVALNNLKLDVALIYNKSHRECILSVGSTTVVIRLDEDGLIINGSRYLFPDSEKKGGELVYETGMNALTSLSSYDIGSQEGKNRSNVYYNYIKYFTVDNN